MSQSGCGIKSGINTTFLARNCGAALSREEQQSLVWSRCVGVVGAWTLLRDVGTSAQNRRVVESTRLAVVTASSRMSRHSRAGPGDGQRAPPTGAARVRVVQCSFKIPMIGREEQQPMPIWLASGKHSCIRMQVVPRGHFRYVLRCCANTVCTQKTRKYDKTRPAERGTVSIWSNHVQDSRSWRELLPPTCGRRPVATLGVVELRGSRARRRTRPQVPYNFSVSRSLSLACSSQSRRTRLPSHCRGM